MEPRSPVKQVLREHAGRFTRYSLGSVVAFATSQLVFFVLYSLGAGPRMSSVLAMLAGVPPAYQLNRRWAFGKSGRSSFRGEVLPYLGIVAVNVLIATAGTELAEGWITDQVAPGWRRDLLVTGAFAAINGALFIGKYLIFDRWLFASRSADDDADPMRG